MGAKIGVLLNCGQQSQFSKIRREFDAGRVNLDPPMTCADWPVPGNLTLLHTQTAYTRKPWHRVTVQLPPLSVQRWFVLPAQYNESVTPLWSDQNRNYILWIPLRLDVEDKCCGCQDFMFNGPVSIIRAKKNTWIWYLFSLCEWKDQNWMTEGALASIEWSQSTFGHQF